MHPELPSPFLSLLLAVPMLLTAVADAGAGPDYTRLSLKGNGHVQDHFSLAVQAAARSLGRDLDYETIYVLSGNAFAPCVDPGESCTAWWMTATGRDVSMDLVARRLGLEFRRVEGPGGRGAPPMPTEKAALQQWFRRYYLEPAVPVIRGAQARGEVVLTDREWPVDGPHGFYPWCWWGIITEARQDGTIVGAGLNGFRDNPMTAVGDMIALRLGAPRMGQEEADFQVLCRAVSRLHGSAVPFLPGERTVYGLEAVDRWIEHMARVPFCPDCKDRSQGCAHDTARPTYEGAQVAARYLRGRAESFPPAARQHLVAAAGCYERVVALLQPAITGEGGESYWTFIGDLRKQQAHVTHVLRPVRAQLRHAADAMEQALRCSVPATASLPDTPASKGDGNAFARGLEILLAQQGVAAEYHTLMGDLGLAFITPASDQAARYDGALDVGWWPLEPDWHRVYLDFAGQTVGRRLDDWTGMASWQADPRRAGGTIAQIRVAHALGAGRAVLANHDFWKVITASDQEAQPLLGFCPCIPSTPAERLPHPAWAFTAVAEAVPRLDRKAADLEALRHAVALGRDEVTVPGRYVTGQKAHALWAATLRDLAHLGEARWHSNMVLHLSINRQSAPIYLEQMAARHAGDVSSHLRAAAGIYRQVIERLSTADTSGAAMGGAAGREALARLVEEIAALELRATGELEAAIAAAGA